MKRAGYIITLMIAFWMVAGGLFFAQSVQAKVVSGSCGGETKYRYDSKSKKLELYGRGVVSQTIRVDEQLSRKNRYFQVKKLVIRQGITAIKDSSVLRHCEYADTWRATRVHVEEKILCRSPFRSSRRSLIFARLGIKETGFTRVETLVSILVPTAVGAATFPPPAGSNPNSIYRMKKFLNPT